MTKHKPVTVEERNVLLRLAGSSRLERMDPSPLEVHGPRMGR